MCILKKKMKKFFIYFFYYNYNHADNRKLPNWQQYDGDLFNTCKYTQTVGNVILLLPQRTSHFVRYPAVTLSQVASFSYK